jgi:predicted ATPase
MRNSVGAPRRWDEARDLLAPVYGWFTEGFDTRDLKEAKAPFRRRCKNR